MLGFTNKQFMLGAVGAATIAVSRMANIGTQFSAGKEGANVTVALPETIKASDSYDAIWILLPAAAAFVVNKYL